MGFLKVWLKRRAKVERAQAPYYVPYFYKIWLFAYLRGLERSKKKDFFFMEAGGENPIKDSTLVELLRLIFDRFFICKGRVLLDGLLRKEEMGIKRKIRQKRM